MAVPLQQDHMGVVPGNAAAGGMPGPLEGDVDVENEAGTGAADGKAGLLQVGGDPPALFRGDVGDDLQLPVRLPGDDARRRRGLQSPQSAGVGDHHALHVFDDVPADADGHLLGGAAQFPGGPGGGVGHGDRLGAAQGGDQLLVEDGGILPAGFV